jgi:hypothetical protein
MQGPAMKQRFRDCDYLLAGLRGLDLERAHRAVDDEVAVVERSAREMPFSYISNEMA